MALVIKSARHFNVISVRPYVIIFKKLKFLKIDSAVIFVNFFYKCYFLGLKKKTPENPVFLFAAGVNAQVPQAGFEDQAPQESGFASVLATSGAETAGTGEAAADKQRGPAFEPAGKQKTPSRGGTPKTIAEFKVQDIALGQEAHHSQQAPGRRIIRRSNASTV